MKKLLLGSVVTMLCLGGASVYADEAHHPEGGDASAPKLSPGKNVPPKPTSAPDNSLGNSPEKSMGESGGGSDAAGMQMGKAQERMKQAQAIMGKLRETQNPAERQKLMREHTQAMSDTMRMMGEMKMGMMGGSRGADAMNPGNGSAKTDGMMPMHPMPMHKMMEERMGMMQMMMEQMLERQKMTEQGGK